MVLAPPSLSLSPPAFGVWRSLHDEVEAELSRVGEFGSVPDIGAKIAENAHRWDVSRVHSGAGRKR